MTATIRLAKPSDVTKIAKLLVADAQERHHANPGLWHLKQSPHDEICATIKEVMMAENPSVRQQWLVADGADRLVGVVHSILLPVPPIYAGEMGPPGLIMEDCFTHPDAPVGTRQKLLTAAEDDLIEAGASILLASSVESGLWEVEYAHKGYNPLTKYFAKSGLSERQFLGNINKAKPEDVAEIVLSSAQHRRILDDLHHRFWKPHVDADARFGAWMQRSLTLPDRDMFVARDGGKLTGYAIAHPATSLHFPTPHDISGVGMIDDFYHDAFGDAKKDRARMSDALALFEAAEVACKLRGYHSVLVVCPATWRSKISLLEQAGYKSAITWHIKIVD